MKNDSSRPRRSGDNRRPNRIEQLAASIEKHLTELDRDTLELNAHATRAETHGCTPAEIEAIDLACVTAPLQMLLIATRTIVDSLPEDSGLDRDRIIEIVERHGQTRTPSYEIARDLLDLIRKCLDYIEERASTTPDEGPEARPRMH